MATNSPPVVTLGTSVAVAAPLLSAVIDASPFAAYLAYVASPEGQSAAAESAGSAPLSSDFPDRVLAAVSSIR